MISAYENINGKAKKINSKFTPEEREALIIKYAYVVKRIANRIAIKLPSSVLFDELVSAGCLGLIDAVDKFDPSKNVNIKTYAEYRIKGAIFDELRSMDWYSRSMRKKIHDIENAMQKVERREGRVAEDYEIAKELGLTDDEYFKILSEIHNSALLSMDDFLKDEDNNSYSGKSFQESMPSVEDDPSERIANLELKQILAKAISELSKKEQVVVSLYYYDELTLKEIGHVLELTESRICQIHTTVLIKLKAKMKKYYGR